MEIWFAIPVHDDDLGRAGETFKQWRDRGYQTVAFVEGARAPKNSTLALVMQEYAGWAAAVNLLCAELPYADWIVTGGADVFPVQGRMADDIAAQCTEYFKGTMGVMQPCGDRYGALEHSPISAAVSPWIGREFSQRAYGGRGPFWEGYSHYFADTELCEVARLLGCFWERPDLNQYHDHYLRRSEPTPPHLTRWQPIRAASKRTFDERRKNGFPGHELNARSLPVR